MILIIDVVVINYHNKNDDYFTIINAGDGILIVSQQRLISYIEYHQRDHYLTSGHDQ